MAKKKDDIELLFYGVTPSDLKRFVGRIYKKIREQRYVPVLWTEELDKKYTTEPRFLVKNGKKKQEK